MMLLSMARLIDERFEQNQGLDLLGSSSESRFAAVSEVWLDQCHSRGQEIRAALKNGDCLRSSSQYLARRTERSTAEINQFVRFDRSERADLVAVYESLLHSILRLLAIRPNREALGGTMVCLLKDHFHALRSFLSSLRDPLLARRLPRVPCVQYTPGFQLGILGISAEALRQPVLDIGCGERASLVRHLRGLGIDAWGIDRFVRGSAHAMVADWLDLETMEDAWGTIVSHMSFSNHFTHHHFRADGRYEEYARAYMGLLLSLKPGGSFYYAPGLPFIERLLPADRFDVATWPVDSLVGCSEEPRTSLQTTRVTRLK